MVLGKLSNDLVKHTIRFTSHTIRKNKLQIDWRSKHKNKTIQVLQENMREFFNLRVGKGFLILTPNTEAIKEQIDQFDYTKIKRWFCMTQSTINKVKRQPTNGEKFSQQISKKKG